MGGIILIGALVLIIVLAVIADKNANKKFQAKFESNHQIKDSYGDLMVSANDELLYKLGSGTLIGYKLWKLSEVSGAKFSAAGSEFSICDASGKPMKGTYLTPSRKPLKEKAYVSFPLSGGLTEDGITEFIGRYVSK